MANVQGAGLGTCVRERFDAVRGGRSDIVGVMEIRKGEERRTCSIGLEVDFVATTLHCNVSLHGAARVTTIASSSRTFSVPCALSLHVKHA